MAPIDPDRAQEQDAGSDQTAQRPDARAVRLRTGLPSTGAGDVGQRPALCGCGRSWLSAVRGRARRFTSRSRRCCSICMPRVRFLGAVRRGAVRAEGRAGGRRGRVGGRVPPAHPRDLDRPDRLGVVIGQIALAFVLFRVFDILKPWPARQLEALPRGWGVLGGRPRRGFVRVDRIQSDCARPRRRGRDLSA